MIFNYNSNSTKPGIYKIVNTNNGRFYIGQAKVFKNRWNAHATSLKNNKHCNQYLQNDYNKTKEELGHDNFLTFEIIELMEGSTKGERTTKEQEFVDKFYDNCTVCYNIAKECSAPDAEITKNNWKDPQFKKTVSEKISATKKLKAHITSEQAKERWADPSFKQATVEKMKEVCNTEEHRALKREIYLKSKEARESDPQKLEEYKRKCSEHAKKLWDSGVMKDTEESRKNKSDAAKKRVAQGKAPHLQINSYKQSRTYQLLHVDSGEIISVPNLRQFANEHGLHLIKLRCLCYGKIKTYAGYVLANK